MISVIKTVLAALQMLPAIFQKKMPLFVAGFNDFRYIRFKYSVHLLDFTFQNAEQRLYGCTVVPEGEAQDNHSHILGKDNLPDFPLPEVKIKLKEKSMVLSITINNV
jgi:hypothetical protein